MKKNKDKYPYLTRQHGQSLEHQQMQASLKLWDNKFIPKPAIKKPMHH